MAAGSIRNPKNDTAPRLCHLMLRRIEFFHPVAVFQNLARLGAVGGADDAIFFHEVDQARGPAVADPQAALQRGSGSASGVANDANGILIQVVVEDRKSTRLNSSHGYISYAVFCLKKKKIDRARNTCSRCT